MLRKGSGKRWKGPIGKVGAATRLPFASKGRCSGGSDLLFRNHLQEVEVGGVVGFRDGEVALGAAVLSCQFGVVVASVHGDR